MKKTKEAFLWIIELLEKHKIPYQVSGGFAARVYGSRRKLADIDIDIQDKNIKKIIPFVKKTIVYGPKRYKDREFDVLLMTLKYKNQLIDISGVDSQKLFNKKMGKWFKEKSYLSKCEIKNVYGKNAKMIRLKDLIDYKKRIARKCDLVDLSFIS